MVMRAWKRVGATSYIPTPANTAAIVSLLIHATKHFAKKQKRINDRK